MELVDKLSQLPPGIVMADSQWGHPRTAIEVFHKYYPHLQIVKITPTDQTNLYFTYPQLKQASENLYVVVDSRLAGERPWVDTMTNHQYLCAEKEILSKEFRGHVFEDSALVLCRVKSPPSSIKPGKLASVLTKADVDQAVKTKNSGLLKVWLEWLETSHFPKTEAYVRQAIKKLEAGN